METLIKIKKAKIILACGGAFVGDHAYDSLEKRNIANRAVKQMRKIIFGILKSAFPYIKIAYCIKGCPLKHYIPKPRIYQV